MYLCVVVIDDDNLTTEILLHEGEDLFDILCRAQENWAALMNRFRDNVQNVSAATGGLSACLGNYICHWVALVQQTQLSIRIKKILILQNVNRTSQSHLLFL